MRGNIRGILGFETVAHVRNSASGELAYVEMTWGP